MAVIVYEVVVVEVRLQERRNTVFFKGIKDDGKGIFIHQSKNGIRQVHCPDLLSYHFGLLTSMINFWTC